MRRIQDEEKKHSKFRDLAKASDEAYHKECTYNAWYPSVQITQAALYSDTPDPEVMRRQRDGNRVQKDAAQIVERAIDYCVDDCSFDNHFNASLNDFLVGGMGQARVVYKPSIGMVQGPYGPMQGIVGQTLAIKHYSWKHFGWEPCKSWEECGWVYFVSMMSAGEVKKRYQVEAHADWQEAGTEDWNAQKVAVYEIIEKATKTITVICEQFAEPLEVREDKLGLKGVFPCPRPMLANVRTDALIPATDFKYIEKQVKELDRVSKRISGMANATKALQFYDASFDELQMLETARDGNYIPVEDLIGKLEGTNLQNVIAEVPAANNANIIDLMNGYKGDLESEIYEILGISDIMRGDTDAREGVETQQLKSEYGSLRIRGKQNIVDCFARDLFGIMGEIIAEHFKPDILQKITGLEVGPEVQQVLRDDFLRNVSIDIETDSTSAGDKIRHKQAANEQFQTLVGGFSNIMQGVQGGIIPQPVGEELLLMMVRHLGPNAGNLEDILATMSDQNSPQAQMQQMMAQMQQMQERLAQLEPLAQQAEQAKVAKDFTQAGLNDARKQETLAGIPNAMAQAEQTTVSTQGKRIEAASNVVGIMNGTPPPTRGIE